MKKLFISILILVPASSSLALTPPTIVNTDTKKEVNLGKDATVALKKWNSTFRPYMSADFPKAVLEMFKGEAKVLPMAVAGDFNGDGKEDFALLGHNEKNQFAIFLVADAKSYSVVVVESIPYKDPKKQTLTTETDEVQTGLSLYLTLLPAKELQFKNPKQKLDALQLENYNSETRAFYVKNNLAKEYKGLIE